MNNFDDNDFNKSIWSEDSNESSIGAQLFSLNLNNSLDSYESLKSRGRAIKKPTEKVHHHRPNQLKTSNVVLGLLSPQTDPSSDYSSISPTNDSSIPSTSNIPIPTQLNVENMNITSTDINKIQYDCKKEKNRCRLVIRRMLLDKIRNDSSKSNPNDFITDYGDTILIKSCRTGNFSKITSSIESLLRNKQILFDHKNYADETALSVSIQYMNEKIIDTLLKYASPSIELAMGNNVMHIAAAMIKDEERRVFGYLLNSIKKHQPEKLIEVLSAKNIFNCCPYMILKHYRDVKYNDSYICHCIQTHIDKIDDIYSKYNFQRNIFNIS